MVPIEFYNDKIALQLVKVPLVALTSFTIIRIREGLQRYDVYNKAFLIWTGSKEE